MGLAFTKMHGAGNDFIVLDALRTKLPNNLSDLAKILCDRRFGVGADQMLVLQSGKKAEFFMAIYNVDGSVAEMCGNAIRCFLKYLRDSNHTSANELPIETLGGVVLPKFIGDHPLKSQNTDWVRVDMGEPVVGANTLANLQLADQNSVIYTEVSMGNPHAVIFVKDCETYPVSTIGPIIENHKIFPQRTNVEFVTVAKHNHAVQRTWERGSGETLACGSGACATVVAGVLTGKLSRQTKVSLRGGDLEIEWRESDNHVVQTGPATTVFEGEYHYVV